MAKVNDSRKLPGTTNQDSMVDEKFPIHPALKTPQEEEII